MEKMNCKQCPRACGADRTQGKGRCGAPWDFWVSRAALHPWEEPCISGTRGSGTVFFGGCNLGCVFCQNRAISRGTPDTVGTLLDGEALASLLLRLQDKGAHNLNLVTPTHYALQLATVLEAVKPRLSIPVVYNTGGYESVETLRRLDGLVDIYLPDFKYASPTLAKRFSDAEDYPAVALLALQEMLRQSGPPQLDASGLMMRGTIVRHLVLPGHREDSIAVLELLAKQVGSQAFLLSLMSQYTPSFAQGEGIGELKRRVTTFEYTAVSEKAEQLGFSGYFQARSSAKADYTPNFEEESLLEITRIRRKK